MIRVLGNSPERVELKDLYDVVYYKQLKEFSDQQHENSKDLKKALGKGRLIIIDRNELSQGSGEIDSHQWMEKSNSLSLNDLKLALREVLPEFKGDGISESSLKNAVKEVIPLIVSVVKQEISKISVVKEEVKPKTVTNEKFLDPTYTPSISDAGLKSNVKAKEKEVSGETMSDALKALKNMHNKSK